VSGRVTAETTRARAKPAVSESAPAKAAVAKPEPVRPAPVAPVAKPAEPAPAPAAKAPPPQPASLDSLPLPRPPEAAAVVTHFVQSVEFLLEINNYNTPAGIVNGLHAFAMNNIWELVEKKYKDSFEKSKALFTDLISLKDKTASSPVPCLPFVGAISLEISKLQAAPDVAEGGLINFDKRKKLATLIDMIKRHQKESYKFSKVAVIWEYISTYRPLDTQQAEEKMTSLDGEVAKKKKVNMGNILGVFKKDKDKEKDKEKESALSGVKLEEVLPEPFKSVN